MKRASFALACGMIAGLAAALAQSYPSRPITFIVPFGAGGPVDTVARILLEPMRGSLGQPILIENVTGASGTIGVGRAARAAPDGYTVSIGTGRRMSSMARSTRCRTMS
jgi:tripartite-type tricarboxylate transporter receptor subunit TctC